MCLTVHGSCLAGGRRSNSLVYSVTPLSFHGSLQAASALMAFKCLTRARTISIGLALSQKEDRGTLTCSGRQLLGPSEPWRLRNTPGCSPGQSPLLLPWQLACSQRVPRHEERRLGRRSPQEISLYGPPKCCSPCAGWKKNFQTRSILEKSEFIENREQN